MRRKKERQNREPKGVLRFREFPTERIRNLQFVKEYSSLKEENASLNRATALVGTFL